LWQEITDSEEVISNVANVAVEHTEVRIGGANGFSIYFPV
jgi:hypothetical protein